MAGADAIRPPVDADAIDGVRPSVVVEPGSTDAVAHVLGWASSRRLAVVVRGGGTKMGWGQPPGPIDILLSTRRLARVLAHAHGDLTATVESGVTLRAMNETLATERQWLPLESACDEATVGGLLATNDAGALQHRFGTPRDLLIGVGLATTDGRLVKAGGTVVKNVAGYDLGKLVTGSFGSLAVIVNATFKLTPMAAASGTCRVGCATPEAAAEAASALAAGRLDPIALDVRADTAPAGTSRGPGHSPIELLIRFASTPPVVEGQIDDAVGLLKTQGVGPVARVSGADEAALWRAQASDVWETGDVVVKVNWLPASLDRVLALVADLGRQGRVRLAGRVGLGAGLLGITSSPQAQMAAVGRLREHGNVLTRAVVRHAAAEVKAAIDVWGPLGSPAALLHAIKQAFDPHGILNAGRGPV